MKKTLILVPTAGELTLLKPHLAVLPAEDYRLHLCGFGPVSSGVRTMQLLPLLQPEQVVLIGIAGSLHESLPPGRAGWFNEAAVYGIGAGGGDAFRTAQDLGWMHFQETQADGSEFSIQDVVSFREDTEDAKQLLTVCAASATQPEVRLRKKLFPAALAEDMEGFSVAVACRLAGTPLKIVRGISNIAGDREKGRWRIKDAMDAAATLLIKELLQDD